MIDGSATPTIETSRASRKRAPQSTSNAPQARLLSPPVPSSSDCESCGLVEVTWSSLRRVSSWRIRAPLSYCSIGIVHISSTRSNKWLNHALQSVDPKAPELATVDVLTVLQALSDPVRLEIVRQLAGCEAGATGLMCGQIALPVEQVDGEPSPQDAAPRRHHARAAAGRLQVHLAAPRRARRALPGPARLGAERLRGARAPSRLQISPVSRFAKAGMSRRRPIPGRSYGHGKGAFDG